MASGQDLVRRLSEEARHALTARVSEVGGDVENLKTQLSDSIEQLQSGLRDLLTLEFPFDPLVGEALAEERQAAEAEGHIWRELLSFAAEFTREVRLKETQEEILGYLLDGAGRFAERVGLLAVREEQFRGWASRGLSEAASSRFGQAVLHPDATPWLSRAAAEDDAVESGSIPAEDGLAAVLENEAAGRWHALPLRALGRTVAVLVASDGAGREADVRSIGLLLGVTALSLENTALKILQEMRTSVPAVVEAVAPPPEPAAVEPVIETPEPPPPVEQPLAPEQPAVAEQPPAEERPQAVEQLPAAEQPPVPEQPPVSEAVVAAVEVVPKPGASATEASVGELDRALEAIRQTLHSIGHETLQAEGARTVPQPPAVELPREEVVPAVVATSDEERLHSDAKRFARLLVSEIKLYNEQRVLEGRHNRDIYVRLKRDIDRSRELYEKRVSPVVSRKVDYFHDEIIRILGDNDPIALGSDYPGPRVES